MIRAEDAALRIVERDQRYKELLGAARSSDKVASLLVGMTDEQALSFVVAYNNLSEEKHLMSKVLRHLCTEFGLTDLVSVQPPLDNCNLVGYIDDNGRSQCEPVSLKTRTLKAVWHKEAVAQIKEMHNTDAEDVLSEVLGQELQLEVVREVLIDLTHCATPLPGRLRREDEYLCEYLRDSLKPVITSGKYDWLVTSPEVASVFERLDGFYKSGESSEFTISMTRVGVYEGLTVYKDALYPLKKVLFGSRINPGFVYGIHDVSVKAADETKANIQMSYYKRLIPDGEKRYGVMELDVYSETGLYIKEVSY